MRLMLKPLLSVFAGILFFAAFSFPALAAEPDTTPPVLTLTGGEAISVVQGIPFVDPGYKSIDDVDGRITPNVNRTGKVDTDKLGDYILTYTSTDKAGNKTTVKRTVTVTQRPDTIAPEIMLRGSQVVTAVQDSVYEDLGYTASDIRDGDLTELVTVTGEVDTAALGSYTLLFEVSDKAGNKAAKSRIVVVIPNPDTNAPVITLEGDVVMTLTEGEGYIEPGFTATDDVDGDITAKVERSDYPDTTVPTVYTVLYTVSDRAGNSVSVTRLVNVLPADGSVPPELIVYDDDEERDLTPPAIYLHGPASIVMKSGTPYKELGVLALDTVDGEMADVTSDVVTSGDVLTDSAGTYTVMYQIRDEVGNIAVATRTVQVIDSMMLSERKPYSFSGSFKKNTPPQIHDITADESGAIDAIITIQNNGSGEDIGIVTATLKDSAGETVISKESIVSFFLSADVDIGDYTLEIAKTAGVKAEYKAQVLMPEIWYEQVDENITPLAESPFEDSNMNVVKAVIILLLAAAFIAVVIIRIKQPAR